MLEALGGEAGCRQPDLTELRRLATETLSMIRHVPGAADASIEQEADQPGLRIQIDRARNSTASARAAR
jgi:cobalt-zinc-cadmium resistance protein CzcA